jgi:hypothetical protein
MVCGKAAEENFSVIQYIQWMPILIRKITHGDAGIIAKELGMR